MRDTQRKRVYDAENAAFPDNPKEGQPTHPAVKDVEVFVKKVWSSKRVQNAWPIATGSFTNLPRVKDGRGCRKASAHGTWAISMPMWSRREWVILHELAHIITTRENFWPKDKVASHGWEFCEIYLKLVLYIMGREAHDALKASFKKHNVKFKKPIKRAPLSPERKAELVAKLAEYRLSQSA